MGRGEAEARVRERAPWTASLAPAIASVGPLRFGVARAFGGGRGFATRMALAPVGAREMSNEKIGEGSHAERKATHGRDHGINSDLRSTKAFENQLYPPRGNIRGDHEVRQNGQPEPCVYGLAQHGAIGCGEVAFGDDERTTVTAAKLPLRGLRNEPIVETVVVNEVLGVSRPAVSVEVFWRSGHDQPIGGKRLRDEGRVFEPRDPYHEVIVSTDDIDEAVVGHELGFHLGMFELKRG